MADCKITNLKTNFPDRDELRNFPFLSESIYIFPTRHGYFLASDSKKVDFNPIIKTQQKLTIAILSHVFTMYFHRSPMVSQKNMLKSSQLRLAAATWITSRSPCHSSGSAAAHATLRASRASDMATPKRPGPGAEVFLGPTLQARRAAHPRHRGRPSEDSLLFLTGPPSNHVGYFGIIVL